MRILISPDESWAARYGCGVWLLATGGATGYLLAQLGHYPLGWWCWLGWPYLLMLAGVRFIGAKGRGAWQVAASLAAVQGPIVLLDVVYLNPDPQGPIVLVILPLLQLAVLLVAGLVTWWLFTSER
ncbi:hypothetical protein [Chitinibacter tainanensis]|uniref:hypothetical protein n=1 Tax=Chitinibacter tainanensis TaxID=230667 RepID=UPI00048BD810|nr:hypothetical protein [Chitinibacter tainanensis]